MNWLYVILAGVIEIFWILGLKYADTWWLWTGTFTILAFSFYLVIKANEKLPTGTVYAVFTGIGAAGIVITDMIFFNEPFSWSKIGLIALVILGVIGLKYISTEEGK